jgi:hypothetical protein
LTVLNIVVVMRTSRLRSTWVNSNAACIRWRSTIEEEGRERESSSCENGISRLESDAAEQRHHAWQRDPDALHESSQGNSSFNDAAHYFAFLMMQFWRFQ